MSNKNGQALATLAKLLDYPQQDYTVLVRSAAERLAGDASNAQAAEALNEFCVQIEQLSVAEQQELFTQTFDFDPDAALEIGWHLFGEDYNRGAFLVKLRGQLRQHGIHEQSELPDHLKLVLQLLGRMPPEEAAEFYECCVGPAIERIYERLSSRDNVYSQLIACISSVLQQKFACGVKGDTKDGRPVSTL